MTDSDQIARAIDATHVGPPVELSGFNSLDAASEHELAFCVYDDVEHVRETDASAVLCLPTVGAVDDCTQLLTDDPRTAFAIAANEFFVTEPADNTAIHPTASVHDDANIGENTRIGPNATIGADVRLGDGCTVRAGATIGGAGFGFGRDENGTVHRLPHRGRVRIEDNVEIGANTTVDRAMFDETVIGRNSKLSANVHVAHQVRIGRNTTIAYGSGFSGRVAIGDGVVIHPHVAIADGVTVGDGAEIGINSTVLDDVPSGSTVFGSPARRRSEVSGR